MLEGTGAAIRPIFDEVEGFAFSTSNHTGVLWALETLAWLPAYFRWACLVLARLAAIDPGGRLANRPKNSLRDILLSWQPSTFANHNARLALLDEVLRLCPEIGWRLIVELLPNDTAFTSGTVRPRLRGSESPPQPLLTYGDVWIADQAICQRAIVSATRAPERMLDLLVPMLNFAPEYREAGLKALETTLDVSKPAERELICGMLRKEILRHRRFPKADWALGEDVLEQFELIAEAYMPDDPVRVVSELFDSFAPKTDETKQESQRAVAIQRLADQHGTVAILELCRRVRMKHLVPEAIEAAGLEAHFIEQLIFESFAAEPQSWTSRSMFGLYFRLMGEQAAISICAALIKDGAKASDIGGLFFSWPINPTTWDAIATLGTHVVESYWRDFPPRWIDGSRKILLELVLALARRDRPLAALASSCNRLPEIPTCLLLWIVDKSVVEINSGNPSIEDNMLDYYMITAFKELDKRTVPDIQIGKREYALLPLLESDDRPLRIHRLMVEDPEMFHFILRDVYRASSEPVVERESTAQDKTRWRRAYQLISKFTLVPGFTDGSNGDSKSLEAWIAGMRSLGLEHDREEITEMAIGNVLAHAPVDDLDGAWPHRFVRDAIEQGFSDTLARGFRVERFNMRGVTDRGPLDGGGLERELAARYRLDAETARSWPKTSALLLAMAEGWEKDAEREDLEVKQRRMRD